MSRIKGKILASAATTISILAIDSSDRLISSPDQLVLDSNFYMITTFLSTVIYLILTYQYVIHVTNQRRKVLVLLGFLSIITVILPMPFFLSPPRWDFEFRFILGIDKLANSVFFSLIYIQDINIKILFAVFISLIVLLDINQIEPHLHPINFIFTCSCCTIVFATLFLLYIRVTSNGKWKIIITALFIFLFFVIILTYVLTIWFSRWRLLFDILYCINVPFLFLYPLYTSTSARFQDNQYNFLDLTELPTRFTFKELNEATRNFQTPIGQGASSTVFKGTLRDGTIVAAKRIKGQPGREDEFNTEIAIIGSLQHINLVHLLGYCLTRRGERYLVYPFFENGSLDTWLFAVEEKRGRLTWKMRYQIAVDVAKALAYLHHDCHHRILHLDVKPANILLGGGFRALLSDFGISRSMSKEESIVMTRARGTVGYLPPEMLVSTGISTKSDVFSYGMVLLELVGGRRNFATIVDGETQQRKNSYFPKMAREKMLEGKIMEVIDSSLVNEQINEKEVVVLVSVAFQCVHERPELRPSMTDVVDMLEGHLPVYLPPESPIFVADFLDVESQSSTSELFDGGVATRTIKSETTLLSDNTISICVE